MARTGRPVDARPLLWVRTLIPLAVIWDLLAVFLRGASDGVLVSRAYGGIAATPGYWFILPDSAWSGYLMWGICLVSMVLVAARRGGRLAMFVALVSYGQLGHFYFPGDRAIDQLLRWMLCILLCSEIAARPLAGRVAGWPEDLIRWVLMLVYLGAGTAKLNHLSGWLSFGPTPELYQIMASPQIGRLDAVFWLDQAWLFTLGGWFTIVLEFTAPLVLTRWAPWWAIGGAAMHLGIALTMDLGMFPAGMLALYPVLFSPWLERSGQSSEATKSSSSQA